MAERRAGWARRLKISRRFTKVSIALLLVLTSLLNITYAWMQEGLKNRLHNESYISVSADGLIMKNLDGEVIGEEGLKIRDYCSELTECTSVDGRNIYFPISNPKDKDQRFRKGDAGDLNSKYIVMEFTLSSNKATSVWLSNESYFRGSAADAVRVSIDCAGDVSPYVFDDGESYFAERADAIKIVESIDPDGYPQTHSEQNVNVLSDFFFSADQGSGEGNVLLNLQEDECRRIVVTIWLEGEDEDCEKKVYGQEDLQINLKFTVGSKNPNVVKFSDCTLESWAYLKGYVCEFCEKCRDENGNSKIGISAVESMGKESVCSRDCAYCRSYADIARRRVFVRDKKTNVMYAMVRNAEKETGIGTCEFYQWVATIPATVADVEFIRLDHLNGAPEIVAEWEYWNAGTFYSEETSSLYFRYYAITSGTSGVNDGRWSNGTNVLTVYISDAKPEHQLERFTYLLNFAYYDQHYFSQNITYIGKIQGVDHYAMRVFDGARSSLVFTRDDGSISQPPGRSSGQNLCKINASGVMSWSSSTKYPKN